MYVKAPFGIASFVALANRSAATSVRRTTASTDPAQPLTAATRGIVKFTLVAVPTRVAVHVPLIGGAVLVLEMTTWLAPVGKRSVALVVTWLVVAPGVIVVIGTDG